MQLDRSKLLELGASCPAVDLSVCPALNAEGVIIRSTHLYTVHMLVVVVASSVIITNCRPQTPVPYSAFILLCAHNTHSCFRTAGRASQPRIPTHLNWSIVTLSAHSRRAFTQPPDSLRTPCTHMRAHTHVALMNSPYTFEPLSRSHVPVHSELGQPHQRSFPTRRLLLHERRRCPLGSLQHRCLPVGASEWGLHLESTAVGVGATRSTSFRLSAMGAERCFVLTIGCMPHTAVRRPEYRAER
jgi:hypothetical protein